MPDSVLESVSPPSALPSPSVSPEAWEADQADACTAVAAHTCAARSVLERDQGDDELVSLLSSDDHVPSVSVADIRCDRAGQIAVSLGPLVTEHRAANVDGFAWVADDHRDAHVSHHGPASAVLVSAPDDYIARSLTLSSFEPRARLERSRTLAIEAMRAGRARRYALRLKLRACIRVAGRLVVLQMEAAKRIYTPWGTGAAEAAEHYANLHHPPIGHRPVA